VLRWYCTNSRYSAPIYVKVKYMQGSHTQKITREKVLLETTVSWILWDIFGYYMKFFLAGWCYYWKNAYYVKELLLCLTWKRWSWTCKTWFVCTRFKYQALSCPCFCAPTSMLCCYIYIIVMSLLTAGECPLDPGGYFVIKGTEKVLFWLSYYSAF
jgi:DNA-directed RNA polymerase beta subunit